jgi:tRNA (mo5U34)-methyltransferase
VTLQSTGASVRGSDRVAQRIRSLAPWFHNLHLPGGRETAPDHPLGDFPAFKWRQLAPALPDDLAGWRALDVGCNAGFYSFELAARGADVLGVDTDPHYLRQAEWAAEQLDAGGRVRFEQAHVYDFGRRRESFDLVLFMGVLYHLRHPLLALDALAAATRRLLVLQTLTMPGEETVAAPLDLGLDERDRLLQPGWPKLAFLERQVAGDPTNWWAPNHAAVEAMLRTAGLEVVERPGHELYVCRPRPAPARIRRLVAAELDAAAGR